MPSKGRGKIEPRWKKGESGNPNGRPRKFTTTLKLQGYTQQEINDTILVMLQMSMDELKAVWDDKNASALELTIASAIRKSITRGSLYSIDNLINRVYGRPKETTDLTLNKGYEITLHLGERTNHIQQTSNNKLSSSNTGQQGSLYDNRSGYQDWQDSITYNLDSGASDESETESK